MASAARVLDASALLAVLLNEPGHQAVLAVLDDAWIHSINAAEVIHKLMREGVPKDEAVASIEEIGLPVQEEFSLETAALCGELLSQTRKLGLSLGDCACLSAAAAAGATAITAERLWGKLEGRVISGKPLRVQVIR